MAEYEMAAFGASEAACVYYPAEDQQKERDAYCRGAAEALTAWNARTVQAELVEAAWLEDGSHTPGPWLYRPHEFDDWGIVRAQPTDDRYGFVICQARNPAVSNDELDAYRERKIDPYEANARLIAAAPELLRALQNLLAECPDAWSRHGAIAAITRATGAAS